MTAFAVGNFDGARIAQVESSVGAADPCSEVRFDPSLPATIRALECQLATAYHAFDDIEAMSWEHRVRVVDELTSAVPDAASAAARAGHGPWASRVVRSAATRRPAWSTICTRWDGLIAASYEAIESAPVFLEDVWSEGDVA
ncbi:hypothetical protein [Frondihabitans cladoniiphilus]|uniref:hypothetical protein n=1 Tax=Frondihabitans cladoniiphilus TaxID=715785 RepID=UPI0031E5F6AB